MTTHKPRLSITRAQMATAVGAELAQLLETITADGRVDEIEVQSIADWLLANQHHEIPAIDHLLPTVHRVLEDGIITSDEFTFLQKEIESVLPPELRRVAQFNRREFVKREKERQLAEAVLAKREFAALASVGSFDFMIAGVSYDGRADRIRSRYSEVGSAEVRFLRMPDNPYDKNAISIALNDGADLGYIPRDEAEWLAPQLDSGVRYEARIKRILDGGRLPIPIVAGKLFSPDHPKQAGQPVERTTYRAPTANAPHVSSWKYADVEVKSNNTGVIIFLAIAIASVFGWFVLRG